MIQSHKSKKKKTKMKTKTEKKFSTSYILSP